ncbi:hypothetical protein KJ780_01915 [Candidatus Micrarchaeota archaeon]|nr:hypothetical protein [Candidatus Micrarchaeota archaeon]
MEKFETKKKIDKATAELESTISGSYPTNFERVLRLVYNIRDIANGGMQIEKEQQQHLLDLLRRAKILAVSDKFAEDHIERIQLVEEDLKRMVA